MKLYGVSDGPPSLAVRMTLAALEIPFELKPVDYIASEHMTDEYAKVQSLLFRHIYNICYTLFGHFQMNPQKEIPVLDDDGFYLSESIAIMQVFFFIYAPSSF